MLGEQQKGDFTERKSKNYFHYTKTGVFKFMLENPQSLKAQETHNKRLGKLFKSALFVCIIVDALLTKITKERTLSEVRFEKIDAVIKN